MNTLIGLLYWRAEGLRFRKQPSAWISLGALFLTLLLTAVSAGLDARAWRAAADKDASVRDERLARTVEQMRRTGAPGPALANATYQAGRGELGSTRMKVKDGLALSVQRLRVLPVELKASLDNRQVDARDPGPLRNPLLSGAGLPSLPAMTALLLPLVALILCAGLLQEEREHGRLSLLRVQANRGIARLMVAALGWRFLALWVVGAAASLPALLLDPMAGASVLLQWFGCIGLFSLFWVALGGVLSCTPLSGAASMLTALGIWLALTFVTPAALLQAASAHSPMPSRLASIVKIRDAQQESEEHEQGLAQAWYAANPEVAAQLPAIAPAIFVARALEQERELRPLVDSFYLARREQAALVEKWSWISPGLTLTLAGEHLAGTDAISHLAYLRHVDDYQNVWRAFLVAHVMDRQGLPAARWMDLPQF